MNQQQDPQILKFRQEFVEFYDEYFNESVESFNKDNQIHQLILNVFLLYQNDINFQSLFEWNQIKSKQYAEIHLDFKKLIDYSQKQEELKYFQQIQVQQILNILNLSFHVIRNVQAFFKDQKKDIKHLRKKQIITRLYNVQQPITIEEITANQINEYISLKGIVLKTSPIQIYIKKIAFACLECNQIIHQKLQNGIYNQPQKCIKQNCKSTKFNPDKTNTESTLYQRIKVQQIQSEDKGSGKIPRNLECELQQNLVGSLNNGDIIILNGFLKTEVQETATGNKKMQGIQTQILYVNSLINETNPLLIHKQYLKQQEQAEEIENEENVELIQNLINNPLIFYLLIKSVCPTIFGHELIKAGLLLAVVGGSQGKQINENKNNFYTTDQEENQSDFRTNCHILLIGDPGLGKSQLLKFMANITQRSIYTSASNSSNAGLTVSVSKDQSTGESTLEAGALILSDQGICCIDEFDKMQADHYILLEAMEQQTISLAKSGILCSLQARCSIIAAANPKEGHYNKQKNVKENIKISNAILSRFDLIFLLLDKSDPLRDKKLSEHIMKLHARKRIKQETIQVQDSTFNVYEFKIKDFLQETQYSSLAEKLQQNCSEINDLLTPQQIKQYITYIKRVCNPRLSISAAETIKEFYLTLRDSNQENSQISITIRFLESLIRLSQARAKIECRDTVTKEDAMEVIQLMQESLFDCLEDLNQNTSQSLLGKSLLTKGINLNDLSTLSVPKQTKIFQERVEQEASAKGNFLFSLNELIQIGKSMNMNVGDFGLFIEKLNQQNFFILKGNKTYELFNKKQ